MGERSKLRRKGELYYILCERSNFETVSLHSGCLIFSIFLTGEFKCDQFLFFSSCFSIRYYYIGCFISCWLETFFFFSPLVRDLLDFYEKAFGPSYKTLLVFLFLKISLFSFTIQHYKGEISELELYFVIVNNEYGEQTEEELLPGGKNLRVTNENVITFIHLVANHRLNFQVIQPSIFEFFYVVSCISCSFHALIMT